MDRGGEECGNVTFRCFDNSVLGRDGFLRDFDAGWVFMYVFFCFVFGGEAFEAGSLKLKYIWRSNEIFSRV